MTGLLAGLDALEGGTRARLLGVDKAGTVAFDFDYPSTNCSTAFIGKPVDFSALTLD